MKTAVKKAPKQRALSISALAATLLGRSRVSEGVDFSAEQFRLAFPKFNQLEVAHALAELVDKKLVKRKSDHGNASYSLTDEGRTGRVSVA
jgi:hypothetical protein